MHNGIATQWSVTLCKIAHWQWSWVPRTGKNHGWPRVTQWHWLFLYVEKREWPV